MKPVPKNLWVRLAHTNLKVPHLSTMVIKLVAVPIQASISLIVWREILYELNPTELKTLSFLLSIQFLSSCLTLGSEVEIGRRLMLRAINKKEIFNVSIFAIGSGLIILAILGIPLILITGINNSLSISFLNLSIFAISIGLLAPSEIFQTYLNILRKSTFVSLAPVLGTVLMGLTAWIVLLKTEITFTWAYLIICIPAIVGNLIMLSAVRGTNVRKLQQLDSEMKFRSVLNLSALGLNFLIPISVGIDRFIFSIWGSHADLVTVTAVNRLSAPILLVFLFGSNSMWADMTENLTLLQAAKKFKTYLIFSAAICVLSCSIFPTLVGYLTNNESELAVVTDILIGINLFCFSIFMMIITLAKAKGGTATLLRLLMFFSLINFLNGNILVPRIGLNAYYLTQIVCFVFVIFIPWQYLGSKRMILENE